MAATALITGTSKGLGAELARIYLGREYRVIGVSRSRVQMDSARYEHLAADITDPGFEQLLTDRLDSLAVTRLNLVVNNAGTGSMGSSISQVDPESVLQQVNLHCIGPLRVVKAVRDRLDRSTIVNITSRLGSVSQTERGDFDQRGFSYAYRVAKAAQNMLTLCLQRDPELSRNLILSVNPGLLRTDSGSEDAQVSAAAGAEAVARTIQRAKRSGIYHAFGEEACY